MSTKTDKWVNAIAEDGFDESVEVKYEIQGSKEIKYFQTKRTMSKYGVIRASFSQERMTYKLILTIKPALVIWMVNVGV